MAAIGRPRVQLVAGVELVTSGQLHTLVAMALGTLIGFPLLLLLTGVAS
jgi:hypothetical protein